METYLIVIIVLLLFIIIGVSLYYRSNKNPCGLDDNALITFNCAKYLAEQKKQEVLKIRSKDKDKDALINLINKELSNFNKPGITLNKDVTIGSYKKYLDDMIDTVKVNPKSSLAPSLAP